MSKRILCVTTLLAFGIACARAEEMATPPSTWITTPTPYLAWSGPYAGINGGYGWGDSTAYYHPNDPAAATGCGATCIPFTAFRRDGGLAGGQIGFNWQFDQHWLAGFEADYQWSDFSGSGSSLFHLANTGAASVLSSAAVNQKIESFGTVRARAGAFLTNSLLFYGTGGFAVGQARESVNVLPGASTTAAVSSGGFSYSCTAGASCFTGSSSKTLIGWTLGGGSEVAVTSGLTVKAELLYVHLDTSNAVAWATAPSGGTTAASYTASFSGAGEIIFRSGINFRF